MNLDIIKSVIIGHAIGDALGVPVEFCSRAEMKEAPVSSMLGYGTYPFPAGSWSDDTSMSLCALDVLANGYCDLDEVMVNFGKWYYNDEFTPTGKMFDVGNTCSYAIDNYFINHKNIKECGNRGEYANGNGSLMRINPFVLYLIARDGKLTLDGIVELFEASNITHWHARAGLGCGIYGIILEAIINMPSRSSVLLGIAKAKVYFQCEPQLPHYVRIFDSKFSELPEDEIKSGGYIVHTLEAALWCLLNTSSYKECVLKAVNLGDDTDSIAAVAGGLAGALYGYDSIPKKWLEQLLRRDYIEEMCAKAFANWNT